MNAQDLTLNIAVNLGRVARWASSGREARVKQFLEETEFYIEELGKAPKSSQFEQTFKAFKKQFRKPKKIDESWVEEIMTWANILTHRAKLAGKI